VNETRSAVIVDFAPAPTGHAAMLALPPILNVLAMFNPLSVMTRITASDTSTPAWRS
jgi:hypothetical protein